MRSVFSLALGAAVIATTVAVAQPAGLPDSIDGYWSWMRLNINRFSENFSGAHPQPKDVYISLNRSELLGDDGAIKLPFPDGTVVVKERNDANELLVDRLYVMKKVNGAWNYSFFDRQGTDTFTGRELGAENFCKKCHLDAEDDDFVFTPFDRRS